jgi:hypothetical protein
MKYLGLLSVIILMQSCNSQVKETKKLEKINGVSFVAARDSIQEKHVIPVQQINANYASLMPFALLKAIDSSTIYYNPKRQWFGETEKGLKQYAKHLRSKDIKIMVKPQIWVWNGEFTGTIKMSNEDDWQQLEKTYSDFILEFARVSQDLNAEVFCIGTELELFVKHRPEYWIKLIKDIKAIYKGKLTYAANWDEYKRTPFWSDLDYIGIDAYFPLTEEKTPSVEASIEAWKTHKAVIKNQSETYNKPILFTEYGYRSMDYASKKPWEVSRLEGGVNEEAQANLTKALLETFWSEPWFAGGFVWKWFHNHDTSGGANDNRFTPQNKPAEQVLKTYYGHTK